MTKGEVKYKGLVKWFNPKKGFGFIQPDDGGQDVFVHAAAVERAGLSSLNEGAVVSFELEQDSHSGKVSATQIEVLEDASGPSSYKRFPSRAGSGGGRDEPRSVSSAGDGRGTVKWFNTAKGFGFIQPENGSTDIFVHISAVERAGLRHLNDGQRVAFELEQDRRSGKTSAVNLRLIDET